MKYIFSILLCLILQTGFSQIIKTVGISYTNGTPTYIPAKAGSALALDTVTWRYYTWNGSTWLSDGFRVQTISGCSAPAYTPTKFQSLFVINACTVMQGGPELYFWNGSAWVQINEGQTYTAGTGISIVSGVISTTITGIDSTFAKKDNSYTHKRITDTIQRTAPIIAPVWDKGGAEYNVAAFGIFPDGTDVSDALLAMLDTIKRKGGGKVIWNTGGVGYNINKKITIPTTPQSATRNGRTVHRIADMTWEGGGSYSTGFSNVDTFKRKATVINLNWGSDTLGRIDTRGLGRFSIRNIAFHSPVAKATPFFLTTNTTLSVENCSFTGVGPSGNETVFMLGTNGSGTEYWSNGADECFQGYGTVLQNNFFNGVGTGFYLKSNANAIVIQNNTFWWQCGGYAAIRLEPIPTPVVGNVISNNLIEMSGYQYGIVLGRAVQNSLVHNNFYDNEYGSLSNILHKDFPYTNTIIQGARGQSSEPDFVEQANPGTTNYVVQNSVDTSTITAPTHFYSPIWLNQDSVAVVNSQNRKYYFQSRPVGFSSFDFGFSSPINVSKRVYNIQEISGNIIHSLYNDYGKEWKQISTGDYYHKAANSYILNDSLTALAQTSASTLSNSAVILSNDGPQPGDVTGYGIGLSFKPFLNRTASASIFARYETSNSNDNISLDFDVKTGGVIRRAAEMNARGFKMNGNYFDMYADGSTSNDRNYTWANSWFNTGYLSLLRNGGSGTTPTTNVFTLDRDGLFCLNCNNPQERFDIQGNIRGRTLTGTGSRIALLDANGVFGRGSIDPANILQSLTPASYDNTSAPRNIIFYSTTLSKLAYKDPGGTVNPLY